jgi:hypothetical protein
MQVLQKIKMLGDPSKFSLSQCFSDRNGKSTIVPVMGSYIVIIGGLVFIYASILINLAIITQAVIVIGIGASLLGVSKVISGKIIPEDTIVDLTTPDSKDASDVASPPNGPQNN